MDVLDGILLRLQALSANVLLVGETDNSLPGKLIHRGSLTIVYALAFLYEPDFFVPHRVIDDFGNPYDGWKALDFMLRRGDAFPRADATGQRISTGETEQVFLKQLDLARPLTPFAYDSETANQFPLFRLDAAASLDNGDSLPERLCAVIPCVEVHSDSLHDLADLLNAQMR